MTPTHVQIMCTVTSCTNSLPTCRMLWGMLRVANDSTLSLPTRKCMAIAGALVRLKTALSWNCTPGLCHTVTLGYSCVTEGKAPEAEGMGRKCCVAWLAQTCKQTDMHTRVQCMTYQGWGMGCQHCLPPAELARGSTPAAQPSCMASRKHLLNDVKL